jgi:hypothetical protein
MLRKYRIARNIAQDLRFIVADAWREVTFGVECAKQRAS